MFLLFGLREGRTWSYIALPALFALWANAHGSFVLGLVIFFIFLVGESLPFTRVTPGERPRTLTYALASFLASLVATFVNRSRRRPLGLAHFSPFRRHRWRPELSGVASSSAYPLPGGGFIMRRKRSDVPASPRRWPCSISLGARRYIAVFMVGTLPFAAMILKRVSLPRERYKIAALGAVALVALALEIGVLHRFADRQQFLTHSMASYCAYGPRCSEGLTRYLLDHPPRGRGFNVYDWGGYLIGRGVNAKLFIDGRMHLWERDGYRPIVDYARMYGSGTDLQMFRDSRFDWAIVQRGHRLDRALERLPGWEKRYGDRIASYYVRPE
jgi:hypothetical protein